MGFGATASIEDLLGVKPAANATRLDLANAILGGLPVATLDHLAEVVAPRDTRFKFRVVPKATLERRVRTKQRLSTEEGDRLVRLAKVFAAGLEVYKDRDKVRAFLNRPHMMLDDRSPLDVALTTGMGADVVMNLLGRIANGAAV